MIPADVTVTAGWVDDAGRLSCALRRHPARAHMPVRAHMSLRPYMLSSAVQRATCNLQPLTPLAAAAAPGTGAAALRPTLPLASRPSPPPLPPVQAQRRCAPTLPLASSPSPRPLSPLHVVVRRSTCNGQPSTPRAPRRRRCPQYRRSGAAPYIAPRLAPRRRRCPRYRRSGATPLHCPSPRPPRRRRCPRYRRSGAAPLHVVVRRSTCNGQPSTSLAPTRPLSPFLSFWLCVFHLQS